MSYLHPTGEKCKCNQCGECMIRIEEVPTKEGEIVEDDIFACKCGNSKRVSPDVTLDQFDSAYV